MLALFDWVKNQLAKVAATVFVVAVAILGQQVQPAQAIASCSFSCLTRPASTVTCNPAPDLAPETNRFCTQQCTDSCRALGMTVRSGFQGRCIPRDGGLMSQCIPCMCVPQVSFSCLRTHSGPGVEPGEGNECPTRCAETCSTARYRDRLGAAQVASVSCSDTYPGICVEIAASPETRLASCRSCIGRCRDASDAYGSIPTAAHCYEGCSTSGDSACTGVPQEQAVQGLTGPSGTVSGSGERRSRIQSGTTASTSEAASLPPGACVQRAIATDAAIVGRIEQIEIAFGVTSSTFTCRRVCAEQERGKCVVGGCPGDASVQCCSPDSGAPPATQCGGRGATTSGAAADGGTGGTAGGATEGGAMGGSTDSSASNGGTSGSSGATDSSGGTRSSTVGSSSVAADSGGLTRLILPSCIEDGGCQFSDIIQVGLNLVRFLFGLAGVLLLVVFVYAGIEYLIAGDASSVKSAEERIKKALLGLFFMFFGYTLVNFMVGLFVRA